MAGFANAQNNPAGAIPVWVAPTPAGSGQATKNITTNTGTLVKTGAGSFVGLSINTAGTASTAAVYDGTSASGTLLGTISTTAQDTIFPPGGWAYATGLFIETAGSAAADITVTYY